MKAPLTHFLIFVAALLFAVGSYTAPSLDKKPLLWVQSAAALPVIDQALLYDFSQRDQLIAEWGKSPSEELLHKIEKTSFWPGYYDITVEKVLGTLPEGEQYDRFYSIRHGEVWRIFTPAILHGNLMHLFFNIVWLFFLGVLVEQRLGFLRYAGFILFAAAFSNTCQYLMSGPNFLGLSGIITALVGFIWMRRQMSFTEHWPVPRITIMMIAVFVFGSFALQALFFGLAVSGTSYLSTGMANTAHITGGIAGIIAAKTMRRA